MHHTLAEMTAQLLGQDFDGSTDFRRQLEVAKIAAMHRCVAENAIAVLSNLREDTSFIVYGRLAKLLGIKAEHEAEEIGSIWEQSVLERIHPDDVIQKLAMELRFLTFVKAQDAESRRDYFMQHVVRMRNAEGEYVYVTHRIYYLDYDSRANVTLALCLYTICGHESSAAGIFNTLTGSRVEDSADGVTHILSRREKEILSLIGAGSTSKEIADRLSISAHTVNGHRQNIMQKLKVRNSSEAYSLARHLGLV